MNFEVGVDDPDRKKKFFLLSGTKPDSSGTHVL
jgi:hypothetical protein